MSALIVSSPATNDIISMIDNHPKLAPTTKMQYKKALRNYLATGNSLADSKALARYAADLPKSSRAFLKSAIRLWTESLKTEVQSQATPENVLSVIATEKRLEAINKSIHVEQAKGEKAHFWLTQAEVRQLLNACADDIYGQRDKVILGLLVGAGLRREELSNLRFEHITKMGDRTVIQVIAGKGAKDRVIPINGKLAKLLEDWQRIAGSGFVARSLGMNRELGDNLSPVQIFRITRSYGERIGKPELAAHDLRRSYAQLGYEAGVPITQISKLLGHTSVATTQKYLNLDLDLETTASDFIPFY